MSTRQEKTAVRVANVSERVFESAVESKDPPTVTALAEMGRRELSRPKPEGFTVATQVIGRLRELSEFCEGSDPLESSRGIEKHERLVVAENVITIQRWLRIFAKQLLEN